jgi:hypothetical protein
VILSNVQHSTGDARKFPVDALKNAYRLPLPPPGGNNIEIVLTFKPTLDAA